MTSSGLVWVNSLGLKKRAVPGSTPYSMKASVYAPLEIQVSTRLPSGSSHQKGLLQTSAGSGLERPWFTPSSRYFTLLTARNRGRSCGWPGTSLITAQSRVRPCFLAHWVGTRKSWSSVQALIIDECGLAYAAPMPKRPCFTRPSSSFIAAASGAG